MTHVQPAIPAQSTFFAPASLNAKPRSNYFQRFLGVLWGLFLVTSIFYVFRSGLPQPGDWMLCIIFCLTGITGNLCSIKNFSPVMKGLTLLMGYFCLVNLIWAILLMDFEFLIYCSFYIFNWCACYVFESLYKKLGNRLIIYTMLGVLIGSTIESGTLLMGVLGYRNRGTFNNPNQLAHYAILAMTIGAILARSQALPKSLKTWGFPLLLMTTTHCTIASLSRAGLAVFGLAALLGITKNVRATIVLGLMGLVFALASHDVAIIESITEKIGKRFEIGNLGLEHSEEFLQRNGIERISGYPQYLVFGSGEGNNSRFSRYCSFGRVNYELHSTAAVMFMSYGVVGIFLAWRVIWLLIKKNKYSVLFLIPIIGFGFNHNGMRQTEFWIVFLVLFYTIDTMKWKSAGKVIEVRPQNLDRSTGSGAIPPGSMPHQNLTQNQFGRTSEPN